MSGPRRQELRHRRARDVERELLRAGARFIRRESSHRVYTAPTGKVFKLCFANEHTELGPKQQKAAWAAMAATDDGER